MFQNPVSPEFLPARELIVRALTGQMELADVTEQRNHMLRPPSDGVDQHRVDAQRLPPAG